MIHHSPAEGLGGGRVFRGEETLLFRGRGKHEFSDVGVRGNKVSQTGKGGVLKQRGVRGRNSFRKGGEETFFFRGNSISQIEGGRSLSGRAVNYGLSRVWLKTRSGIMFNVKYN